MTEYINREKIINRFIEYTSDYDLSDPKIKLKYDHTFRVANLCERIAKGNQLSEDDCALAWLTGMLHDIGRFEQVRRYGTFADNKSIDHAQFGADLLFISLTFELVYPISKQIVKEQGYLDKLLNFKSDNRQTNEWFAYMKKHIWDE